MFKSVFSRAPWEPLSFPNKGFDPIPADKAVEEETLPDYVATRYYPVTIGEIFQDRYQVVAKLGYGATSTVWLARDLSGRRHVALKLFIKSESMGDEVVRELGVYKRIERTSKKHPGRSAVRSLLASFEVEGPEGQHLCLVHPPFLESVRTFLRRNSERRLPAVVVAFILKRLLLALDYLHNECHVIHGDLQDSNIMFDTTDTSVFKEFEKAELNDPCRRKEIGGRTIYESRKLEKPIGLGAPIVCDLGSALALDDGKEHREVIQPAFYRAPEVILGAPLMYSADMWNVGCMVWHIFEGGYLFTGHDPEDVEYSSRAHLAQMIALLGPPPSSLLAQAARKLKSEFFSDAGDFCAEIPIPERKSLEDRETSLDGDDRVLFLDLMRKMMQWEPGERSSAKELAEHQWILKHTK